MKKIITIALLIVLGNLAVAGEAPVRPIKTINLRNKSNTSAATIKTNPIVKSSVTNTGAKKVNELKSDLPKIPQDWGHLVKGEFVMDGAYLALYFEDKDGNIRVAIYSTDKKVKLYKLMVFPREKK